MAPEGCAGISPIPRSSREHDSVAHLQTSRVPAMAECSGPPQPARTDALGTFYPSLEPVESSTPSSAPLSRCTLLRHSSFVRAVCVDALVTDLCGGRSAMVVPTATVSTRTKERCSQRQPPITVVNRRLHSNPPACGVNECYRDLTPIILLRRCQP